MDSESTKAYKEEEWLFFSINLKFHHSSLAHYGIICTRISHNVSKIDQSSTDYPVKLRKDIQLNRFRF